MKTETDWFTHARFGMFIHWGLYAIPATGHAPRMDLKMSDAAYREYFDEWNPHRFDPQKWAALAKRAGQKYAVITAKHHEGFCLFDSALTDYKTTSTPAPSRDLMRDWVEAFRAEGLRVGFYYSLIDWNYPHYPIDYLHPLREDEAAKKQPRELDKYIEYLHGQVRELMTNYGQIDLLWLDYSYDDMTDETWRAKELVEMIRGLQPEILLNDRLVPVDDAPGRDTPFGDFSTPEQFIPEAGYTNENGDAKIWEACLTFNGQWGYARDDLNHKSAMQIVRTLVECVSKGGNLLLNVGPTALGEIRREEIAILEEVGKWMDENSASVVGCTAADLPKPEWGRYTQRGNTVYAHVFDRPSGPIHLPGLAGKIKRARLLRDGSVVAGWNAHYQPDEVFVHLPGAALAHAIDTVIALELKS